MFASKSSNWASGRISDDLYPTRRRCIGSPLVVLSNTTPPRSTPKADFLLDDFDLLFETSEIVCVSGILIITGNTPGAFRLFILFE